MEEDIFNKSTLLSELLVDSARIGYVVENSIEELFCRFLVGALTTSFSAVLVNALSPSILTTKLGLTLKIVELRLLFLL